MTSGAGEQSRIVEIEATAAYGGRSGGGDGGAATGRSRRAAASWTGRAAAAWTVLWRRWFWWCRGLGDERRRGLCAEQFFFSINFRLGLNGPFILVTLIGVV
jgi:hypothetical protein